MATVETVVAIQVRYSADTKRGVVQDAMYFAPEEYAKLSQDDLEAMAQKRADDYVTNYIPPVGPTAEELQAVADDLDAKIAELVAQKDEVTATLSIVLGAKLDAGGVPRPIVSG